MKKTRTLIGLIALFLLLTACSRHEDISRPESSLSSNSSTIITAPNNLEIGDIKENALHLLSEWKGSNYSSIAAQESFYDLTQETENLLGKDNYLSKLLSLTYMTGMFEGSINVVDMAINILSFDKGDPNAAFIGDSVYLFDDCRFDYGILLPAYDLSSGLYGVFNVETHQYIYEPTLNYLSSPDANGYICLGYKGFYGCINTRGEKVVGFMYDAPITFSSNVAVVKTNNKYGVVNSAGETVLKCQYDSIEIYLSENTSLDHSVIMANWPGGAQGKLYKGNGAYGAYTLSGTQIIPHSYLGYQLQGRNIYMLENVYNNSSWYDLYDSTGKLLFGPGTDIPEICSITLPGNYGISIGRSTASTVNVNGISTSKDGRDYWYTYISDDMKYINDGVYQLELASYEMTLFNINGYAVASIQGSREGSTQTRVVLDKNGAVCDEFAYIYASSDYRTLKNNRPDIDNVIGSTDDYWHWLPVDANDYLYHMSYSNFSTHHALYVRSTGHLIEYDKVNMIDGTNLTIVKDADTGLFGLFDGSTLALDLIYNSISYTGNTVVAKRGAEEFTYTPSES